MERREPRTRDPPVHTTLRRFASLRGLRATGRLTGFAVVGPTARAPPHPPRIPECRLPVREGSPYRRGLVAAPLPGGCDVPAVYCLPRTTSPSGLLRVIAACRPEGF